MEEAPKKLKFKNVYHGTNPNSEAGIRRDGFWDSTKRFRGKEKDWSEKGRVFVTPDKDHAKSKGRLGMAADEAKKNSKVLNLKVTDKADMRQVPQKKRNYTLSQKDADQGLRSADKMNKYKIRRPRSK